MNIGILHANNRQAEQLVRPLSEAGYETAVFACGGDLDVAMQSRRFDLLLMRWDGHKLSGVALAHRLRRRMAPPPGMVMLVDADAPGAIGEVGDAILPDPCSEGELVSCIQSVKARLGIGGRPEFVLGELRFDDARSVVEVNGVPVQLTTKEYALAQFLMQHSGTTLSRDEIMASVWNRPDTPGSRTLDAHMAQLRKRLLLRPEYGWRLSSVYGSGYRLDRVSQSELARATRPPVKPRQLRTQFHSRLPSPAAAEW